MYEYIKDETLRKYIDMSEADLLDFGIRELLTALNEALGDIQKYEELFGVLRICGEENIMKRVKEILAENEELDEALSLATKDSKHYQEKYEELRKTYLETVAEIDPVITED